MTTETWVTIPQAAAIAGRSEKTIYRWISEGRLPSIIGLGGRRHVNGRTVLTLEAAIFRGRHPTNRPSQV